MPRTLALHGQRFGKLFVVSEASASKPGLSFWLCRCDCGNKKIVQGRHLKSGNTKSCGCLQRALVSERNTVHGLSRTSEYKAWKGAEYRCTDPNNKEWANYGGRGIEFKFPDFDEFLAHIGPRPSKAHSLDRINNDGHYEPSNIRWALRKIQDRNKRTNRLITYQGETLCIADWAKRIGCCHDRIAYRLRVGWSVKQALETPIGAKR